MAGRIERKGRADGAERQGPFHPEFRVRLEGDERTAWAARGLGIVSHAVGEARARTAYWHRPLEGGCYPGADPVFVGQVACLAAALARAVRSRAESEGAAPCGPPVFADPSIEEELGYAKYERWLVGRNAESVRRLIADLWELTHARVWVETMERLRLSPSLVMHDGGLGRAWWGLVTIHAALHGEEGPDFFAVVMPPQARRVYVAEWPKAERRRVRDHLRAHLDGAASLRECLDLAARLPQECARRNAPEADSGW